MKNDNIRAVVRWAAFVVVLVCAIVVADSTVLAADNIVWGTGEDNIVWGTIRDFLLWIYGLGE